MRRKLLTDNMREINEMRNMLSGIKKLTLENFIMPEEGDEEEGEYGDEEQPQSAPMDEFTEEIKQAIVQIRKISISVIAKLADNPTSEGYTFMKRVLDMSDKAMESLNGGAK